MDGIDVGLVRELELAVLDVALADQEVQHGALLRPRLPRLRRLLHAQTRSSCEFARATRAIIAVQKKHLLVILGFNRRAIGQQTSDIHSAHKDIMEVTEKRLTNDMRVQAEQ